MGISLLGLGPALLQGLGSPATLGHALTPPQAFLFPELCSIRKWTLSFQQEAVSYISLTVYWNIQSPSDAVVNPDAGKMVYGTRMEVILQRVCLPVAFSPAFAKRLSFQSC